ncbi:MAG: LacI family transcriptional regulator [Clostridia bacterium]|nr:LacI family transcriptional regulator [Clostridia bacterium]
MNIKEVASKAGVSITTVSRVLNTPEKVNNKTREKVLSTMEELNYTPNWFARNLQTSRSNIIGVVMPDTLEISNMETAKGVEDIAHKHNSNIILVNTAYDPQTEKTQVMSLIERKIDGLILIQSLLDSEDIKVIRSKGIPFVFVGKNDNSEGENVVYTNYDEAVEEVINYLAYMNRKKIAVILPENQEFINREKLKGYIKAMKNNSLDINESYIIKTENSLEGGYVATSRLLDDIKPDAIFAATDTIAFGAIESIKQNGLTVDDVGVVGFEGLEAGAVVEPKLTTVIKPSYRMGLTAGRVLFDMIEDELCEDANSIMLQAKMKIRKSCGNKERIREIW